MFEMNGHHMRRRLVCKYELFGKVVNFNNAAYNCNGDNCYRLPPTPFAIARVLRNGTNSLPRLHAPHLASGIRQRS